MATHIADVVNLCLRQRGDVYIYGVEVSPSNPNPAAFDCSELLEWACARMQVSPRMPDGSWAQYNHSRTNGLARPVNAGIHTYGAMLFRGTGPNNPASEHVALSLGDGNTIEARGRAYGVNVFGAYNREWHAAGLIPGCIYDGPKYHPPPVPIIEEPVEVILLANANTAAQLLLDGGKVFRISDADTAAAFGRAGVKTAVISDNEWNDIYAKSEV